MSLISIDQKIEKLSNLIFNCKTILIETSQDHFIKGYLHESNRIMFYGWKYKQVFVDVFSSKNINSFFNENGDLIINDEPWEVWTDKAFKVKIYINHKITNNNY